MLSRKKRNEKISEVEQNVILDPQELLDELIQDYSENKQSELVNVKKGQITKDEFIQRLRRHIHFFYNVSDNIIEETVTLFMNYIFGYSYLNPLINDPDVSDIRCIAYNNIRMKKNGKRMQSDIVFPSEQEYNNFIDSVATRNQVNISNLNAIQRFTDNTSNPNFILRFTVSMPLVNTYDAPYLVIRKVPKNFPMIEDLIKKKMLDEDLAEVLIHRFTTKSSLVCGGNSSGKTTILNALKETIPDDVAVLIAQQADELTTKFHPDMMFLHSLPGSSESQAKYDLKNISIAGLTMDVDFFIIGEVKGDEAIYLLNAAYTGQICSGTIHAPAANKGINKLIDYAMQNSRYNRNELMKMMDCFKTVIFMKKYKVQEVYAVKDYNYEKEELEYEAIWENGSFVNGYNKESAKYA